MARLTPEQLLARLTPEQRLQGLSLEQLLQGLSPEKLDAIERYLKQHKPARPENPPEQPAS